MRYATKTVEILDQIIAHGFPVVISSAPQAGATSPAALGGTLVQITAEQLSGFVYVNRISPGQPGAEKGITNLAAALAGSNFIHHSAGFLESLLTVAYEQFVIDNDTNGAVMRMVRGIEVDEKNLSVDVIDDVCLGEGHYLSHTQTLELMNSEFLYPSIMNRDSRDDWEARGSPDIREAARARTREILAEH